MKSPASIVWVTGAGRGIGRAAALAFAADGACVIASGRTKRTLDAVVKEIAARGGLAHAVVCDVRSESSIKNAVKVITRKCGPVDVLVNNAGIGPWKDFLKTTVREFDDTISTNLRGMFICTQAVAPSMIARRRGMIINVLSTAAIRPFPGNSAYCASKFGGLGLTRVIRGELKKHNIRVVAVLPGAVETPMWDAASRKKYHERMMQPEDVAAVMVQAARLPARTVVEEILMRPLAGDI